MHSKSRTILLIGLGVTVGLAFGVARGVLADKPALRQSDLPWADARMLAAVLERIKRNYMDRDEYDEIKIGNSAEYSGVGLELSTDDGQLVAAAAFEGSPAAAAAAGMARW